MTLQTSLQEVLSHKRVVEALTEKAAALSGSSEAPAAAAAVAQRYEKLVDSWLQNITQLEEALDTFTHFQDLFKGLQEHLKQLQERLSSHTGELSCLGERGTVKILVVILTTIPWLIFIPTLSSRPFDDTVVTHVISI